MATARPVVQFGSRRFLGQLARGAFHWQKAAPVISSSSQSRFVTNATKPDHVESLLSVKSSIVKPGGWKPTTAHSSGEVKFTVIRVEPGGEVPKHYHNSVWDYFMPLEGEGLIEVKPAYSGSEQKSYPMAPQSFLAVPPGDTHRVRNASQEKEFVFFLAQSPRQKYDFVDTE